MISVYPGINTSLPAGKYTRGFKPVVPDSLEHFIALMTTRCWSPCVWRYGYRVNKNFIGAKYCALDFDDGLTIEAAKNEVFADYNFIIGTTKSHQIAKHDSPACDRFRVILLFEQPITCPDVYKATMSKVCKEFGSDRNASDPARFFYPCKEFVHCQIDEYGLKIELQKPFEKKFQEVRCPGKLPRFAVRFINSPPTQNRNKQVYALGRELWKSRIGIEVGFKIVENSGIIAPDFTYQEVEKTLKSAYEIL